MHRRKIKTRSNVEQRIRNVFEGRVTDSTTNLPSLLTGWQTALTNGRMDASLFCHVQCTVPTAAEASGF